ARHSAYASAGSAAGLRVSRAFESDLYGEDIENGDEADEDIYNRMENLAQDVMALVNNLEY
ncbi:hypothetical protein LPJ57_001915, partial [Coemansia sp. RSA 486]